MNTTWNPSDCVPIWASSLKQQIENFGMATANWAGVKCDDTGASFTIPRDKEYEFKWIESALPDYLFYPIVYAGNQITFTVTKVGWENTRKCK